MTPPALPTPWHLYNLSGSPFFQGVLEDHDHPQRPLSLFVGRKLELQRVRHAILGAGGMSSRHAIAGAPGVGKTTLVQELKASLREEGYFTSAGHVQVLPGDTPVTLFMRILAALHEILLLARPHLVDNAAMQEAQALVRVTRASSLSISMTLAGVGVGGGKSTSMQLPADVMADGLRVLRTLLAILVDTEARGVLLHLNNLENLSDTEAAAAADVLRSLRDLVFMQDMVHTLVVGTVEAVQSAVNRHAQMRSVFSTIAVEPLPIADVHQMLAARYEALRYDQKRPALPPIDATVVDTLYDYFRGDLRGFLKALDEGVADAIGLAPSRDARSDAWPPLRLDDVHPFLSGRARDQMELDLPTRLEQLDAWGSAASRKEMTQAELGVLWGLSQSAVSAALDQMQKAGYVVSATSQGRTRRYALSGTSRLVDG